MKTKYTPICLAAILSLAACGEKRVSSVNVPEVAEADENSMLLFTQLQTS